MEARGAIRRCVLSVVIITSAAAAVTVAVDWYADLWLEPPGWRSCATIMPSGPDRYNSWVALMAGHYWSPDHPLSLFERAVRAAWSELWILAMLATTALAALQLVVPILLGLGRRVTRRTLAVSAAASGLVVGLVVFLAGRAIMDCKFVWYHDGNLAFVVKIALVSGAFWAMRAWQATAGHTAADGDELIRRRLLWCGALVTSVSVPMRFLVTARRLELAYPSWTSTGIVIGLVVMLIASAPALYGVLERRPWAELRRRRALLRILVPRYGLNYLLISQALLVLVMGVLRAYGFCEGASTYAFVAVWLLFNLYVGALWLDATGRRGSADAAAAAVRFAAMGTLGAALAPVYAGRLISRRYTALVEEDRADARY